MKCDEGNARMRRYISSHDIFIRLMEVVLLSDDTVPQSVGLVCQRQVKDLANKISSFSFDNSGT